MKAALLRVLATLAVFCSLPLRCQAERLHVNHFLRGANSTAGALRGANATAAHWSPREPKVYFLFLAVDKVSNLDVWKNFFALANPDQYRAFIHCKLPQCNSQVSGSPIVSVPTVPSYYCTDLVSPMHQLLAYALSSDAASPHPQDKFAYVSDSTLPAKPFAHMYSTLVQRQGSDFCVFPSNEWADVASPGGGKEVAVKHHQWITLGRNDGQKLATDWAAGKLHNFMPHFRMNHDPWQWGDNSFADSRNYGCLDEFWHMAALYGTLNNVNPIAQTNVALSGFVGGPLHVSPSTGWQGACDTFVVWSRYLHLAGDNPFERLHNSLDPPSVPHPGNHARPGWWDTISTHGIRAIRHSDFLFVRKWIDGPRLADGPSFTQAYTDGVLRA